MLVTRQVLRPLIKSRSISACRLHSSSFICRSSAIGGIENAHKLAELSLGQIAQVELYLDTLFDWNTRMNLTGWSFKSPLLQINLLQFRTPGPFYQTHYYLFCYSCK